MYSIKEYPAQIFSFSTSLLLLLLSQFIQLHQFELILFFILVFGFGIPHGALDHIISFSKKTSSHSPSKIRKFYLKYFLLISVTVMGWFLFPKVTLLLFILFSAWHFGQSQLFHIKVQKIIIRNLIFLIWGSYLLVTIIFFNVEECVNIFSSLDNLNIQEWILSPMIKYVWIILSILIVLSFFIMLALKRTRPGMVLYELIVLLLITLIAIKGTAVLSFAIYFGLWHSFHSLILEYKALKANQKEFSLKKFILKLLPYTMTAITGLILFFLLHWYYINFETSPYLLFIILISVLTIPHLFVMEGFYKEFSGRFRIFRIKLN